MSFRFSLLPYHRNIFAFCSELRSARFTPPPEARQDILYALEQFTPFIPAMSRFQVHAMCRVAIHYRVFHGPLWTLLLSNVHRTGQFPVSANQFLLGYLRYGADFGDEQVRLAEGIAGSLVESQDIHIVCGLPMVMHKFGSRNDRLYREMEEAVVQKGDVLSCEQLTHLAEGVASEPLFGQSPPLFSLLHKSAQHNCSSLSPEEVGHTVRPRHPQAAAVCVGEDAAVYTAY